ncbi:hypothetical protein D3C84_1235310 [compost metagenome]
MLNKSKVQQADVPFGREDNISRMDIPMKVTRYVDGRCLDFDDVAQHLSERKG